MSIALYNAEQMCAIDTWAIVQEGVPSLDLMERAGHGLAELTQRTLPSGRIAVLCGGGNNGGDGFVAARLLRQWGRDVSVFVVADPSRISGDAKANLERLSGDWEKFAPTVLKGFSGAVDALLGTGFTGGVRGGVAEAIDGLEQAEIPVVAADLPSGVDASTGEVIGGAVRAVATATFHAHKLGLWISPGKRYAGHVEVVDIGIPKGAPILPLNHLMGPDSLLPFPRKNADSHKYNSGVVGLVGGSVGLTGALSLATRAAQRVGAGYATVCTAASLSSIFENQLIEAVTVPLPDREGVVQPEGAESVLKACQKADALVLGPGLGRSEEASEFALRLVQRWDRPLLVDADALQSVAGSSDLVADRSAPTVLTPHVGEAAVLLGIDASEVQPARLASCLQIAERYNATVVLKGDDTLVVSADGRLAVSPGGCPALATAGTGDVLAGIVGTLLAKGLEPFDAARAGVLLHLQAGLHAATTYGNESVLASDVIAALPSVLTELTGTLGKR